MRNGPDSNNQCFDSDVVSYFDEHAHGYGVSDTYLKPYSDTDIALTYAYYNTLSYSDVTSSKRDMA
jgi:hypothetical protein